MRENIHPKYQKVLFVDSSTGQKFVCGSTLQPKSKEEFEGVEYPVFYLPISSASHPFFTGSTQLMDVEGRVEKFRNRYATAQQKQQVAAAKPQEKEKEKKEKEKAAAKPKPKAKKEPIKK